MAGEALEPDPRDPRCIAPHHDLRRAAEVIRARRPAR